MPATSPRLAVASCQTDVSLQEQQRAMQAARQGLQAETDQLRCALVAMYEWCFATADRGQHLSPVSAV